MSDKDIPTHIHQIAISLKEMHPFPSDLSISSYIMAWLRPTLMSLGRRGNLAPFVNQIAKNGWNGLACNFYIGFDTTGITIDDQVGVANRPPELSCRSNDDSHCHRSDQIR